MTSMKAPAAKVRARLGLRVLLSLLASAGSCLQGHVALSDSTEPAQPAPRGPLELPLEFGEPRVSGPGCRTDGVNVSARPGEPLTVTFAAGALRAEAQAGPTSVRVRTACLVTLPVKRPAHVAVSWTRLQAKGDAAVSAGASASVSLRAWWGAAASEATLTPFEEPFAGPFELALFAPSPPAEGEGLWGAESPCGEGFRLLRLLVDVVVRVRSEPETAKSFVAVHEAELAPLVARACP
jgi:hypothetical protein